MKDFYSWWSKALPYFMGLIFGLAVALLIVSIVMFQKASRVRPFLPEASDSISTGDFTELHPSTMVNARKMVSPAVVTVTAYRTKMVYARPRSSLEWFMQFSGRAPRRREQKFPSYGSGIIVNPEGYILTNEHVIRNADEIYVSLSDSTEIRAEVKGKTASFDLALLKIEGSEYPYAPLGDSGRLQIGEPVIAIGSPFTYLFNDNQTTVTSGVISALKRDVRQGESDVRVFNNMIQTDATINPGNSGGPLVSSSGRVVGINTFMFSGSDNAGNVGMGFAIPINTAKMVMEEIITHGRFRHVWTGLGVVELDDEMVQRLNLPFEKGLFIQQIDKDGPAGEAGLKVGDIIVEIDGRAVRNFNQANRLIFGKRVGDTLQVKIWREGEMMDIELRLAEALEKA